MPTPYGSRGGVALSADELRVVRDALAIAIESSWGLPRPARGDGSARGDGTDPAVAPAVRRGAVVRDCTELAAALDETAAEADRMRLFRNADLAHYRAALPGSASGYAALLHEALAAGYVPRQADIAALRALCADSADSTVAERRRRLLRRCEALTAGQVPPRRRPAPSAPSVPSVPSVPSALLPRPALRALPGGREARGTRVVRGSEETQPAPGRQPRKPGGQPQQRPPREEPPDRRPASPNRPVPTPAEVFPPRRRRPAPPAEQLLRPPTARTA